MAHLIISPPQASEFVPYFGRYISLVSGNDILTTLSEQRETTAAYFRSLPKAKGDFRYAPGKWTIKQVIGHIIDTERLFAYRALAFARADAAPLPSMEQEDWMAASTFNEAGLADLIEEFDAVRHSTILFFAQLSQEAWMRRGVAGGNPFTVRALAYIIAGHVLHHLAVLKTKYAA